MGSKTLPTPKEDITKRYRKGEPKMTSKDMNARVIELKELERMAEEVAAEIDSIKDELKKELTTRGTEEVDTGTFKIRYKEVTSNRFNSKGFKADYPELYKEYQKPTTSMRFTVQ